MDKETGRDGVGWGEKEILRIYTLCFCISFVSLNRCTCVHRYLVDMLHLELSLEDARKQFKKEIKNALKTTTRQIDDMFHNLAHRKTTSKKKSKKTS